MRGVWIYEIAELAGMRRSEVEKQKAFASRRTTGHDRPMVEGAILVTGERCTGKDQYEPVLGIGDVLNNKVLSDCSCEKVSGIFIYPPYRNIGLARDIFLRSRDVLTR